MNNESLVYLNKVFTDLEIKSCPLMTQVCTTPENFEQQLFLFDPQEESCDCDCDCSCGCNNCGCDRNCGCSCGCSADLDCSDLNFVVDSTEVIISDFDLACPSSIEPCNVTVDGIPVDMLEVFNERYMAATNDLMSRIGDCSCMENNKSTKGYLLISGVGGFHAKLSIILRGSVFSSGCCKKFKLVFTTRNNVCFNIPGQSTFATSQLCLPCTTGGIAPIINFSFSAKGTLLNPIITACQTNGNCHLSVTGCLVTEPVASVQVTRQSLFRLDAEALPVPCDDIEKCRQNIGQCGRADDDSNAFSLRNRCCNDGSRVREDDDDDCGCRHDNDCGCGCGTSARENHTTSITCQFNGRNGCSF